ncbi:MULTISPECIES: catabolite repressor/activator [Salinivibrio]|uniref:Autoinducer 2-binding periplasmic protein LuxP n=1 Tax=Salinivibrio siamensis TaxID=414286 RepID=A0ABX3KAQ1_9GAMM|nr:MULTISPECIES: catabolite repressor/activator [Salinivibrio]KKA45732.1 transcriptional regulator [Salinivibrio sp. KP-1]MPS31564.1 catabolite repressor/activator [Salinivibrio sp. VYel7]MPX90137.1 catabolite repressor/activator [Salinivibrio sp. VYel1]MPX92959.1 catabolite repressor/activator [Salinivibrio sp. VYel9]MPX95357.1 catabolite repressor/activator [Salinivibrio sp. VYel6]
MKLDEIARLAGVSRTTASYVINGKADRYRISEKTRARVMAVVEQHNYQPNRAATALRAGTTQTLGLVVPDLANTSYATLAKLFERKAHDQGYQVIITGSDDDPEREKIVAETLVSRKIDALIVASCLPADNTFYPKLQQQGTPIVAIDRGLDANQFANVLSDDEKGAYQLTEMLIAPTDVYQAGLIGAVPSLAISQDRENGFRGALAAQGVDGQVRYGQAFSRAEGQRLMTEWIEAGDLPDALLTTSFTLCEGVLDAIRQTGIAPTALYFATFGDSRILDFLPFGVQSLPQQFEAISDAALSLAVSAAQGDNHPGVITVERQPIWRPHQTQAWVGLG